MSPLAAALMFKLIMISLVALRTLVRGLPTDDP